LPSKPISVELVKNLLRRDEEKLPKVTPYFTAEENEVMKKAIKERLSSIKMRGKSFQVKFFQWQNKPWVTIRPKDNGFVPMVSGPVEKLTDKELEL
jgi:restriction endonuclease S subunit